jgi:TRAP-type C4-dicarboxylate transport system permease small subunit
MASAGAIVVRRAGEYYVLLLRGMMGLAAVYLGLMMVAIIYFTTFRTLGIPYSGYSFVFIEYGFIYCIMLGAPWIARQRGHIYIEVVTAAVPERVRQPLSRVVAALCTLVFALLAWYSGALALEDYLIGELDVRGSIDTSRWIVTGAMPIGFGLMAVEFSRFIFGREIMHAGRSGLLE